MCEHCKKLPSSSNGKNYAALVDATLSRIIIFNKRRGGETARLLITSYHHDSSTSDSGISDIESTLSQTERQLCSRLKLVEISRKTNRTVPVLLNEIMIRSIDCLITYRNLVGIDERNPFVFPRISDTKC